MLSPLLRAWNDLPMNRGRERDLPRRLSPYVPAGAAVLDVGCGDGAIAAGLLAASETRSVCGVDPLPRPAPAIPVVGFDGATLPYADDAFDLVTLIDVLHHTRDPARLLGEAARVSRGPILIKDHYWDTRVDRWLLTLADYVGNAPYGVDLPFNFLRMAEWVALFDRLSLSIGRCERFTYGGADRCKQVIFRLDGPGGSDLGGSDPGGPGPVLPST